MKVLMINGSPHAKGTTWAALHEMEQIFLAEGVEVEFLQVGHLPVRGCIACRKCRETGTCVFDDLVNEASAKLVECDGLVLGSPVYYASANSTLTAFLDRLFFSCPHDLTMKVGAAVAAARRGGITATFDQLNKYFTISGMPVVSGQYWNGIHGSSSAEEAAQDGEGMQQMRTLARNMVFLMKSIQLGKEAYGLPEQEERVWTNFIR